MAYTKWMRLIRLSWLLFGLGLSASAHATIFQLEVGLSGLSSDRLEIARDPDFRDIIVTARVGHNTSYLVNIESSGRYTYRLIRASQEVERETFIVILEAHANEKLLLVKWQAQEAGTAFRLSFYRPKGQKSEVLSNLPLAYLRASGVPWLMRVRSEATSGHRGRPVQALEMEWTAPKEPKPDIVPTPMVQAPPAPPVLQLDPFAKDDDQEVYEPEYRDLLRGSEKKWWELGEAANGSGHGTLPPLKRQHRAQTWIRQFSEEFQVNRRDRYASKSSGGIGTGFGLNYYLQPTFQLALALDTHATNTAYDAGGTEPPAAQQKRVRLMLGALIDVMNLEKRRDNFSLDIGTNLAFVQAPVEEDNQKLGDIGVQATARYLPWQLSGTLRVFKSQSYEIASGWTPPWTLMSSSLFSSKQKLQPLLGLYWRQTKAKEGAVNSLFKEFGLQIGLELNF